MRRNLGIYILALMSIVNVSCSGDIPVIEKSSSTSTVADNGLDSTSATSSLSNKVVQNFYIDLFKLHIVLDRTAEIRKIPSDADSYQSGMRVSIGSHDQEGYRKLFMEGNLSDFYNFYIYESIPWTSSDEALLSEFCKADSSFAHVYDGQGFRILQPSLSCTWHDFFLLRKGNSVIKIEVGQDTKDENKVWEVLKTIQFDS